MATGRIAIAGETRRPARGGVLTGFLAALAERGVAHALLDRDDIRTALCIAPADRGTVVALAKSLPGTRLVLVARRDGVTSLFLEGAGEGGRRIARLDLVHRLAWRGVAWRDAAEVAARATAGTPAEDDATLIALMARITGGATPPAPAPREIDAARLFEPLFGGALALQAGARIATGSDEGLRAIRDDLFAALRRHALRRAPVATPAGIMRHAFVTARARIADAHLYRFSLLGPDGSGKSTALEGVVAALEEACDTVRVRHLKATLVGRQRIAARGIVTDPHRLAPRGWLASNLKILAWLAEAWIDTIAATRDVPGIDVFDRYFDDILVDARRYRFAGSRGLAKLIARLMPRPDLIVILDAPAAIVQARKSEVTPEESARQRTAYLALAGSRADIRVVDAAQPIETVRADILDLVFADMARKVAHAR